jgi:HSP20 family protein
MKAGNLINREKNFGLFGSSLNGGPLFQRMEKIFQDLTNEVVGQTGLSKMMESFRPACDVHESDKEYDIAFDAPGIKKEDLHIDLSSGILRISGERKYDVRHENGSRHRVERGHGSFERSFTLPEGVDSEKIHARYDNGVLHIRVPKKETAQTRKIAISEFGKESSQIDVNTHAQQASKVSENQAEPQTQAPMH